MGFSTGRGLRGSDVSTRLTDRREVYPSGEVPHLWAHGLPEGKKIRNGSGTIFAVGSTIYSYGYHFPMAKLVALRSGEVVYLVNPESYSVSTSGHQSAVRRAIPGYRAYGEDNRNVYHLPPTDARSSGSRGGFRSDTGTWEDLANRGGRIVAAYYQSLILKAAADATTGKRVQHKTRAAALERIPGIVSAWREVHKVFGLRCSVNLVKAPAAVDLETARGIIAKNRASIDRANKAEREREAKQAADDAREQAEKATRAEQHVLPQWRKGGTERVYLSAAGIPEDEWSEGCITVRMSDLVYPALRIRPAHDLYGSAGEFVQSSQGAIVPLGAVRAIVRVLPNPDTFSPDAAPVHIADKVGDYGPIEASAKCVRVGCHLIPWSEVVAFCQAAGIEYPH